MLRLRLRHPEKPDQELTFYGDAVTIGRSGENQLQLDDPAVSSFHGRLDARGRYFVYVDLGSTNGTIVHRDGKALAITGRQVRGQVVGEDDRIKVGPFTLVIESNDPRLGDHSQQVLHTQSLRASTLIDSTRMGVIDPRINEQVLTMLTDAHATIGDPRRLFDCLKRHMFRLLPKGTHLSIVLSDPLTGALSVVLHEAKDGTSKAAEVRVSRTMVSHVMREEVGVLLIDAPQELQQAQSVVMSGIVTAICAPLRNTDGTFGAIQLDVREQSGAPFDPEDLGLLANLSDLLALILDNHRQRAASRSGVFSAVECMLRERTQTNPNCVSQARRIRTLCISLARGLRLSEADNDVLSVAASLVAWPRMELPNLVFPDSLSESSFVASCREERLDGSGPNGLTEDQLPMTSRILSLAAEIVKRCDATSESDDMGTVLDSIETGESHLWDETCVRKFRELVRELDIKLDDTRRSAA